MAKKTESSTDVALSNFDGVKFLKSIESEELISKKVAIINRVLNQESGHIKNLQEEMKKKGLNASAGTNFDYIPIAIIEESLRQVFFRQIDITIQSSYRDLNSFIVVARLRYKDPITNEYRELDGIGAKALQQDFGKKIFEFNESMKFNALELGVGSAYSRAVKNASKKLGKLFGADLNRDDELSNVFVYANKVILSDDEKVEKIESLRAECSSNSLITDEDNLNIDRILETGERGSYDNTIAFLLKAIKAKK